MLVIEKESVSLGQMTKGSSKTFEVNITNTGDTDAEVVDVRPGCGSCTVSRVSSSIVPAGTTIQLISTFTPNSTGILYKKVTIQYQESGMRSSISLNFNATVV